MEWSQVLTIMVGNLAVFLWIRKETRDDMRMFEKEIRGWKEEIDRQIKDFYIKLCQINPNIH